MEEPTNVFVLGTAGCGKSTLVAAYADWMYRNQYSTTLVNLDPGVETLPYEPDVDVRDLFTLSEVMEDYSLGPNGAQIVAADMLALNAKKLKDDISSKESHYIIYDTPGQLELFTF
ncbi:MAG: ATP/GTP-binding protein, partial [Thermoplasmata archaeon]|nr:ATP/GTP-binding protein [Thermoplasmata archaeon]